MEERPLGATGLRVPVGRGRHVAHVRRSRSGRRGERPPSRRHRPRRWRPPLRQLADVRPGRARSRRGTRRTPRRRNRCDEGLDGRRRRGEAPDRVRPRCLRRADRPLPGPQPRRMGAAPRPARGAARRRADRRDRCDALRPIRLRGARPRHAHGADRSRAGPVQPTQPRGGARDPAARSGARPRRDRHAAARRGIAAHGHAAAGGARAAASVRRPHLAAGGPEVEPLAPGRDGGHPGHELRRDTWTRTLPPGLRRGSEATSASWSRRWRRMARWSG